VTPPLAVIGAVLIACAVGCDGTTTTPPAASAPAPLVFDVHPGDEIQPVLDRAAEAMGPGGSATVRVHAGTYRPARPGQALIWFNERHDGITLEAVGDVVLSAANEALADPGAASAPAVVNHVVFFGDGVTGRTVLRGFTITGANHFVTEEGPAIEPYSMLAELQPGLFFYADGGGIKVFGRSYPTLERLTLVDNYASPCAGGISIEHRGFTGGRVTIRDCVFRDNRCQVTGAAIDVLPGSAASIENCLFVENVANTGEDTISAPGNEHNAEHGSGALTVFEGSIVEVRRCTFTANWNGVDDKGRGNVYADCIFWMNTRGGGISPGARYEIDALDGSGVRGCRVNGTIPDLRGSIDESANDLAAADPDFDEAYRPRAESYRGVGYRPPDGAGR
jgi:hypothetical protein